MNLVKVGDTVLNLDHIASAHWDGDRLFVHTSGGRWRELASRDASMLWTLLEDRLTFNSDTAELKRVPQE